MIVYNCRKHGPLTLDHTHTEKMSNGSTRQRCTRCHRNRVRRGKAKKLGIPLAPRKDELYCQLGFTLNSYRSINNNTTYAYIVIEPPVIIEPPKKINFLNLMVDRLRQSQE